MSVNNQQEINTLVQLIQDEQLSHALKLADRKEVTVNKKTYKRKPSLTASQWRDIASLYDRLGKETDNLKQLDLMIEMREKAGLYYFGIPKEVVDENYEALAPVLEACVLKSNTGLSSDINLSEILQKYQKTLPNK